MAAATTTLTRIYTSSSSSSRRRCCSQRDEEEGLVDHLLELGTIQDDMATTVDNETKSSSSRCQRDAEEVLVDCQLIHGTTTLHEALKEWTRGVGTVFIKFGP
ncbi:hypothetical protein RHSIM_Rhsim04G0029000 [Rhododendron simsii]|uniref:Uncharacterized protein n=1 Tax=Rhododendron simsii TaxID=118357 RepID=A0A834H0X5_RHOSS|nr:hypothetical protein RHSIM_Rhsim04G0029000 [Rhododendron simsii]